jgi:nucleotide-binding universal stress UspA family protein
MEEEARTRMASARDRVGAAGATVDVLVGEPVHTLREVAAVSDLLVVGSRGHGVLGSVLLGGVSGPLAAHADGPVLVVPRPG